MKKLFVILITLAMAGCGKPQPAGPPPVRVAVIGGMFTTGMWQRVAKQFEADMGIPVQVVAMGNKDAIAPVFRAGQADLLTMHSCDEATALVADGYAMDLRPWTWNEQVIVGPPSDPAKIRGMKDGAAALRKIAESKSPFIDAQGGGRRMVMDKLWEKSGVRPTGDWMIKDESATPTDLLRFAESKGAYAICGRIPVLSGKIPRGSMEIMVEGDGEMQRPFVVMVANPKKFPTANVSGAKLLADYLLSEKAQSLLKKYAEEQPAGVPLFYPLK